MHGELETLIEQSITPEQLPPASVNRDALADQPEEYRDNLIRIMSMQAYAERLGALELAHWVPRTPNHQLRRVCARICSDEANHASWLYRELEAIGVSEGEALEIAEGRTGKGPNSASLAGPKAVADDDNTWMDVPLNNMFLDRAGRYMVSNFSASSFEPWARVSRRILKDEKLHEGFGLRELKRLNAEHEDRDELAGRVTKWFTLGLNFFGPPKSSRTEQLRQFGLKRIDNETLRQAFRREVDAILERIGATDLVRLEHDAFPYS